MPVCARDTGIYIGFFGSFLFLWLVDEHKRKNELPSGGVLVAVFIGLGALIVDGVSSYLGLRETTNIVRLLTGMMTGFVLPILLFPVFNYQIWKRSSFEPILRKRWEKVALCLSFVGLLAAMQLLQMVTSFFVAEVVSVFVVFCIFFTFIVVNLVLVTLVPYWYQKAERKLDLLVPFLISACLAALELSLASMVHRYLISLVV